MTLCALNYIMYITLHSTPFHSFPVIHIYNIDLITYIYPVLSIACDLPVASLTLVFHISHNLALVAAYPLPMQVVEEIAVEA